MHLIDGGTLTSVSGIKVGHWSDSDAMTGCTVIDLPEPNIVSGETRGAAPGSRETALLEPGMSVEQAQAFVLAGGSAFGLACVDGVMHALETDGRGFPTPWGSVPIVPAAALFDLGVGSASVRPTAEHGAIRTEQRPMRRWSREWSEQRQGRPSRSGAVRRVRAESAQRLCEWETQRLARSSQ